MPDVHESESRDFRSFGPKSRGRWLWLCLLWGSLGACRSASSSPRLDLSIVQADGSRASTRADLDTLILRFAQGSSPAREERSALRSKGLSLSFALPDFSTPLRFAAELTGPSQRLWGALPTIPPVEAQGGAVVLVGKCGGCEKVAGADLPLERYGGQGLRLGSYALHVGGRNTQGLSRAVDYLDLLRYRSAARPDLPQDLEVFAAVPLDESHALLATTQGFWIFDLNSARPAEPLAGQVHAGAESGASLIYLPGQGAFVVGGGSPDAPVAFATWVTKEGAQRQVPLQRGRFRPALVATSTGVWIASGHVNANDELEELRVDQTPSRTIARFDAPPRIEAHWFCDAMSDHCLLFGGVDPLTMAPRAESLSVSACSQACTFTAGPRWEGARRGVLTVANDHFLMLIGGEGPSATTELLRWNAGVAEFAPGSALTSARAYAAGLLLENGVALIWGGLGEGSAPRADVEICFPGEARFP